MTTDPNAPATKEDIRLLMDELGRLYAANERWKDDIIGQVDERIVASEERVTGYFDVVAETIRHDFRGAFSDKLDQHEDRIIRVERQAGLRAR
jgi:predicted methyltransferase